LKTFELIKGSTGGKSVRGGMAGQVRGVLKHRPVEVINISANANRPKHAFQPRRKSEI
jgi:hypothetical protein